MALRFFSIWALIIFRHNFAKNLRMRKKEDQNEDCPICRQQGYNINGLENKIFSYAYNRSYLFCSITGKVTNLVKPQLLWRTQPSTENGRLFHSSPCRRGIEKSGQILQWLIKMEKLFVKNALIKIKFLKRNI